MSSLFIKAFNSTKSNVFQLDLETLITIFVHQLSKTDNINLIIKLIKQVDFFPVFTVDFSNIKYEELYDEVDELCIWPIITNGLNTTAGLSAVCRKIIKGSTSKDVRKLLGFREACLMACNESSIWTKFCEVDIISTVKDILLNPDNYFFNNKIILPSDLVRFEYHLEQPVRIHNVYNVARKLNKNRNIKSNVPVSELNIEHSFGEGLFMTLADVLLLPCFKIIFNCFPLERVKTHLPLVTNWYKNMLRLQIIPNFQFETDQNLPSRFQNLNISENDSNVVFPQDICKQSLYVSDPSRYKPQTRIFTKQEDIETIINFISKSNIEILSSNENFYDDIKFDWSKLPTEVTPASGALPEKRILRKTEQLENLVKATIKLAGNKSLTIVDFCSGSGHLGILVATLLPNCKIMLVENKERSLQRAIERVEKIKLKNVTFLQCNLDYFQTNFDIGLALHACGVATDLVIQTCINKNANFICCPCCYGGVHNCHHLSYPRSQKFKKAGVQYNDFLILSHTADQTHLDENAKTIQGYLCMNIVDCDRKYYAEEHGYKVYLGKLKPESCTPKNNLLIGIKLM